MTKHPITPKHTWNLSLSRLLLSESLWEATNVVLKFSVVGEELNVSAINLDTALLSEFHILVPTKRSESPVLGHDDLLSTWELVLRASKSLDCGRSVSITGSDGQENLANVDAGDFADWLAEGAAHAGLQSISSGT